AVAAFRHRKAVQRRGDGGGRSRRVDENCCVASSIDSARVDSTERDERRGGLQREGEGSQHRYGHRRRQAGQRADDGAGGNAGKRQKEIGHREGGGKVLQDHDCHRVSVDASGRIPAPEAFFGCDYFTSPRSLPTSIYSAPSSLMNSSITS